MGNVCLVQHLTTHIDEAHINDYNFCSRNSVLKTKYFSKWLSLTMKKKLSKMKTDLDNSYTRNASMHQQLFDYQNHVSTLEEKMNKFNLEKKKKMKHEAAICCICFEETQSFILCANEHVHCEKCIDKLCLNNFTYHNSDYALKCASTNDCDCTLPTRMLTKFENGNKLYMEQIHVNTMKLVHDILTNDSNANLKLRYIRHDGTYKAFSCAMCGFGPLEHFHCNDLKEFHKKNGTNNSCPNCNNFVDDISLLKEWDGESPWNVRKTDTKTDT